MVPDTLLSKDFHHVLSTLKLTEVAVKQMAENMEKMQFDDNVFDEAQLLGFFWKLE